MYSIIWIKLIFLLLVYKQGKTGKALVLINVAISRKKKIRWKLKKKVYFQED